MKYLSCGCCGCGFRTWKGYVDQDQDKGFGICKGCQGWIESLLNAELDQLANKIENALNIENASRFADMPAETRRLFATKAINDGLVRYTIKGRP